MLEIGTTALFLVTAWLLVVNGVTRDRRDIVGPLVLSSGIAIIMFGRREAAV